MTSEGEQKQNVRLPVASSWAEEIHLRVFLRRRPRRQLVNLCLFGADDVQRFFV